MSEINDKSLIKLYQSRSEIAISETKRKYGHLIFSVVNGILKNREDAEECESDTYLGLWDSIPPEEPVNFKAYCLKIAGNLARRRLEYYSAEKRDRLKNVSYEEIQGEMQELSHVDPSVTDNELNNEINLFIEKLSKRDRKVFILRYWYVYSVDEISSECGISSSQVKSILFRTRRKLKFRLIERGFYSE